jgi:hypothetical protein
VDDALGAGVKAPAVSVTPGCGIHAVTGAAYRVTERFSVPGQPAFRDLVPERPFKSSVHMDGITFPMGVAFTL